MPRVNDLEDQLWFTAKGAPLRRRRIAPGITFRVLARIPANVDAHPTPARFIVAAIYCLLHLIYPLL
jgi:hypothetical protein